jgi:hypothetical protein
MSITLGWWMVPFVALPFLMAGKWTLDSRAVVIVGWAFMAAARWL